MKKYYIDKRPLPILLLIEYKNAFLLAIGFIVFFLLMGNQRLPEGMSIEAYRSFVIFLLAIFLWTTNIIPLAITSLGVMGLLATFQVIEGAKVYSFFGNEAIFFILGAFVLSAGVESCGLNERVAYFVLTKYKERPEKLVLAIFVLAGVLSHIMPSHAAAALLFPILLAITQNLKLAKESILGKYMFFSLAWGAVIGSGATLLGGARGPLAIGILTEQTGLSIGFSQWFIACAPPMYVMGFMTMLYLRKKAKLSQKDTMLLKEMLQENKHRLGKIRFSEIKTLFILSMTLYMWIFQSDKFGIANISLISATLFFVLKVVTWEEAKDKINWGAILMYGGAIALGRSLVETGLLTYFSERYLVGRNIPITLLMMGIFVLSIFLTEGVSNTAVIVILLPILLEVMQGIGVHPQLAVYITTVPAGLAFMFPMSSPPNAIAFSSGFITPQEAIRNGLLLKILAIVIFIPFALIYWPFIGIY
jgi:sodium-dependent dicarboxylate transporter 2/3/5